MNGDTLVVECALLLITNSTDANYSGQFFCLWSIKNLKYCSSSWFILSIWLSICGWNTVDSFVSIPNMLFNSLIISAVNYGFLSDTMLSGSSCSFHTLSLNNLVRPFTDVSSVVATKCVILDTLSQTTRITSFPTTTSNFVINSTIKYIYSFSGPSLNFNFSIITSVLFFILWHISHPSIYFPISLVIPSH